MEDIISLELIKGIFGIERSLDSDLEAKNKLIEIEQEVVKLLDGQPNTGIEQANDLQRNADLIRKDEVFRESIEKFLQQHHLVIDDDIYQFLPSVISRAVSINLKNSGD